MRFIHTSDWHIGRLFQNISLLEDQVYVLNQLLEYAKVHNIDALLISGDIYDRAIPPADAVQALDEFFSRLEAQLSIPVILISGNHDSGPRLSFGAKRMQQSGLHIQTQIKDITVPVIIKNDEQDVAVYGIPYHDPVQVREAFCDDENAASLKTYDQAHTYLAEKILAHKQAHHQHIPAVLLSHCFIDGASESDSERPLSIGGADRVSWQPLVDFNYVALGHLHGPQFKGEKTIRYSGSLLKYSFSEYKQKKAVTLVDIDKDGKVSTEQLPLKPKHDLRIIEGTMEALLDNALNDDAKDDYILVRLTDKQVILDPMGRLRKYYPNILQLERSPCALGDDMSLDVPDFGQSKAQQDEQQVFKDFFEQVMSHELNEAQQHVLAQTITQAKTLIEGK